MEAMNVSFTNLQPGHVGGCSRWASFVHGSVMNIRALQKESIARPGPMLNLSPESTLDRSQAQTAT
jgi:hypothetical protein